MSAFYEFEQVDVFTTGAVGQPGDRTFFLQARIGKQRIAVKCEKQQVAAIAQHLDRVLDDLPPPEDKPLPGSLELAEPIDPTFVLGPVGLGYDRSNDRLIVQLEEVTLLDEDGQPVAEADGHIRVFITRGQAAAFCVHAEGVIGAGRPDCQWCDRPIDPDGHACVRMN